MFTHFKRQPELEYIDISTTLGTVRLDTSEQDGDGVLRQPPPRAKKEATLIPCDQDQWNGGRLEMFNLVRLFNLMSTVG